MRNHWIGRTVAATLIVVCLGTPAAPAAELSKAAFITAGDKICKAGNDKLNAEAKKIFGALKANEQPTAAMMKSLVDKAVPILRGEVKDLRVLTPPKADAAKLKKLWEDLDAIIGRITKDPKLLLGNDNPFAKVDAAAAAYGFKECGNS